jgi:homoserine dehydrogenase
VLYGHGAGMMPTASAVVGDVVDLARNLISGAKRRIPSLSFQPEKIKNIPVLPIEEISTHYYFRFSALDRPGVLSKISGILGDMGISIKTVHQKGRKTNGAVPLVMLTHRAKEVNVKEALAKVADLDVIDKKPTIIRIENENQTG